MNKQNGWVRAAWGAAVACGVLAGCDGSGDEVPAPAPPAAVADPCPAIATGGATSGGYVCAANVGVSDLEKSVALYKGLGMTEKARLRRTDRDEVVLASPDGIGSHLVLFHHLDATGRDYTKNPGKIVFYVKDAVAFGATFAAAGGTLTSPPTAFGNTVVGFGRDRDNNLVEIAQSATATTAYISAIGLGVSDLEAARTQYINAFGFKHYAKISVTKPNGAGGMTPWYDEYILTSPTGKGASIVLMTYTDGSSKNYTNVPVSVGVRVPDPAVYAKTATDNGATVTTAPAASTEALLGGLVSGAAKDTDGTVVTFYRAP